MSTTLVNVGAVANDGTGDQPRTAFQKINAALGLSFPITAPAYGAKIDGVTDDTAAWLAAIAAAKAANGGAVIHPGGNSVISLQANTIGILVDGANITLRGMPGATITLTTTATPGTAVYLGDASATTQLANIRMEGIKVDCGGSTDTKGIRVGWTDHATVKDCEVVNIACSSGGQGISIEGTDASHICTNCLVEHNYVHTFTGTSTASDAIIVSQTARTTVTLNQIHDTGRAVFFDGPNTRGVVGFNTIFNLTDNGIRFSALGGGLWSDNNGHTVIGNTIDTVAIDGIRCNGLGLTITGNTVLSASNRGIKADAMQESVIAANIVRNCTDEGIMLEAGPATEYNAQHRKNLISDNVVTGCGGSGIRIQGGGFDNTKLAFGNSVRGNYCYQNAIGGLEFEDCDDLLVEGNQLEENTTTATGANKQGIYIDMAQALSSIHGIRIRANRAWDLRSTGGGLNFLQVYGVKVQCTNAGATINGIVIEGNDFSYSPTNGVHIASADIAGTVGNVRIDRNTVTNTSNPIVCRSTDTGQGNIGQTGLKDISGDRGDASPTLTPIVSEQTQMFQTQLTANRTATLVTATSTFGIPAGTMFRIVRNAATPGNFSLTVQDDTPATVKVLASGANAFVDVAWTGAKWIETAFGTL